MLGSNLRKLVAVTALVASVAMVATVADARVGGGSSFGSRGTRTYMAPPRTNTAPNTAAPIQRSVTQPSQPGFGTAPARPGGFFSRPGLLGGLAAGFLGAGLFGLLFGHGLLGGLGGLASFLGLLLQIALVVIVGRFLWTMWQRRNQPAFAGGPMFRGVGGLNGSGLSGAGLGSGAVAAGPGSSAVEITPADYDAFERLLSEIQAAYSAENVAGLRAHVTPEMLSYFSEQLAENASRGVVNQVSDVKLLKGDLAEAWHENSVDYATVAMRFSLIDRTVERSTGRLVEGSDSPQEVTEVWTFMRSRGGNWLLSAIQQV
jgi:predicted lipid-binding transport protein (Tim44 family)